MAKKFKNARKDKTVKKSKSRAKKEKSNSPKKQQKIKIIKQKRRDYQKNKELNSIMSISSESSEVKAPILLPNELLSMAKSKLKKKIV